MATIHICVNRLDTWWFLWWCCSAPSSQQYWCSWPGRLPGHDRTSSLPPRNASCSGVPRETPDEVKNTLKSRSVASGCTSSILCDCVVFWATSLWLHATRRSIEANCGIMFPSYSKGVYLRLGHTNRYLVAVRDVFSGHPSISAGSLGIRLWFCWRKWTQVSSTNGASLENGAVLHLPLAEGLRCWNDCTTSMLMCWNTNQRHPYSVLDGSEQHVQ